MKLLTRGIDDLRIDDESSLRRLELYAPMKEILRRAGYRFRCLSTDRGPAAPPSRPRKVPSRWDRALLLNLTFWGARDGDVLDGESLPADVVLHAAWHHAARRGMDAMGLPSSADSLLFAEAIASAFDLFVVGRLLAAAPRSSVLASQVTAMAEVTSRAGLGERAFTAMLGEVAEDPARAFEDLRALLFLASTKLVAARDATSACAILDKLDRHRFGALLHHYELSSWVLYVRAYAAHALAPVPSLRALDRKLARSPSSIDALFGMWCAPLLREAPAKPRKTSRRARA